MMKLKYIQVWRYFISGMYLSNPHHTSRMWHKVNFKAEFNRFEFRVFFLLDMLPCQD